MHTCTPRVTIHLLPSKMGHGMHVKVLWQNKNKTKDYSPSMTLSWLPKQNDQVPQKFAKDT